MRVWEKEIEKRKLFSHKQAQRVAARWENKQSPDTAVLPRYYHGNTNALVLPKRNRIRDRNSNRIEKPLTSKSEKTTPVCVPDHLTAIWPEYLEMRRRIRKEATHKAEALALQTLRNLSTDPAVQVRIVEQSIENSWQGFFALKPGGPNRPTDQPDRAAEKRREAKEIAAEQALTRQRQAAPRYPDADPVAAGAR